MDHPPDVSAYPAALLVDILDRVVDDAVMAGLDHRYGDITRSQGVVFEMIDPAGSRVADMARRARITKQAMGQLVAGLEDLGYVERVRDPADGRAQLVRLTATGARAASAGRRALEGLEARWRAELGARRYDVVRAALADLVGATGSEHVR